MRLTKRQFNELVDRIQFTKLQPNAPIGRYTNLSSGENVFFSTADREVRRALAPLQRVPGMSTLANAYLIYSITQYLEADEAYVNIGVWKGFTFLAGVLNRQCMSIGVDNFSEFGGPREEFLSNYASLKHDKSLFWDMDYIEYFKDVHDGKKIGFYFYDGPHGYQDQLRALELAEPFLGTNAMIMVDDTNHPIPRGATLDFVKSRHGKFEIVFDQFTGGNHHPTFHNGLMFLRSVV